MGKQELYEHSPIRDFDKATNGGIKAGEMALVTSKKGLGKTSVLVQFGMDTLLQDKQVVHVTFDLHSSNVISWYDAIFTELAKKKNLGNSSELKDSIVRNRTILNFSQDNFNLSKVVATLNALKAGGIAVAGVVMDGVDLAKASEADIKAVADYAKAENVTVWMSATADSEKLNDAVPAQLQSYFAVIANLSQKPAGVVFTVQKLRDADASNISLKLDSKTLLMSSK